MTEKNVLLHPISFWFMDDNILLDNIIKGDHHAFRLLMERYCGALFVFASRMLTRGYLAEDIVQESFEIVWSNRKILKRADSIKSYLYGIVRNRCLAAIRASKVSDRYKNSSQPDLEEDTMSKYIETETMRLLMEAIETLPPRSAQVMQLSLEGLKQEFIADQMGITVATVKALKAEGVKRLRDYFVAVYAT